jgi:hypothetical protein
MCVAEIGGGQIDLTNGDFAMSVSEAYLIENHSTAPESRDMRHSNETPPFLGPDGEVVRGSIAETDYVRLGGLE